MDEAEPPGDDRPGTGARSGPAATAPLPHTVTELRLALVCYGGVSLAVYMHGVTKELHKLVVASRRFDELGPAAANPFAETTDTEHAYFETLRDLARENRLLSVNVDVVAGTSAGGINGVCLAKTLARNGSQDALKRLWIDEGDLTTLLRSPPVGGWRTRAALAAVYTLGHLSRPVSPLRGERMSQLLYDAIAAMEQPVDAARRSLLLPGTPLDLFVTLTDLDGFAVLVPSGTGGVSQRETDHAQVVQLRSGGSDDAFGPGDLATLAFAARATSSFPGAFAPVSVASFARELDGRPLDAAVVARAMRRWYVEGDRTPADAWFVDGGVLDNAPFDLVVEAIAGKRAQTEVVRRLVYIQPDPGTPLGDPGPGRPAATAAPGYLAALGRAVGTVKGSHSILRDLEALHDLNVRIAELGAIAALQGEQVRAAVDAAWGSARVDAPAGAERWAWDVEAPADVERLADAVHASVPGFVGATYPTYCRLKVEVAGDRLADEVVARFVYPPRSNRASFVRAAISAWARGQVEWSQPDPSRLMQLLGPVDVPYRERRLMFVLAGVNQLYARVGTAPDAPRRPELDALKSIAWQLLDQLREAPRDAVGAVTDSVVAFLGSDLSTEAAFSNPEAFAREHDEGFRTLFGTYRASLAGALASSSAPLWQAFTTHTGTWTAQDRRALLSRYLGFPLWDGLIFPTVALSRLPQFTPITVSQFSPLTAVALPAPAGGKLKGVGLHHFAGFVDAAWRENDYLWGRLDGAELVLRMLRTTGGPVAPTPSTASGADEAAEQAGPRLRSALTAVLGAEGDLRRVDGLRQALAGQVGALPGPAS